MKQKLTATQLRIYNYIVANKDKVKDITLRNLAGILQVSPASVVRTLKTLGYKHYFDLQNEIKIELKRNKVVDDITYQAQYYFDQDFLIDYDQKIASFKKIADQTKDFIFFGIGTSGDLCDYGARQFVNNGRNAFAIDDPYYPIILSRDSYQNKTVIVLSVSGEGQPTIEQVKNFRKQGAQIVSITNEEDNTIAKLSDLNFSYHLEYKIIGQTINLTTQIPVVYLLERLSRALQYK
ncbi:MurR/RpiR family transcriptional regulator [Lactobacillus sp. ESL0791]|uniref:MurR/RpiR family transcriptional regulator n=1 Tax=Lactobacillus sp. ESL0791 TaxID=2983234 RepID=UPI0023F6E1A2|nr:MurR/RpiR family transcriptional regulator [Lactobacillus sp. ESL0791]MDF7638321.1 MurR/RpiR family transcriptional regulator [Lactobacillus sp. ESL0791]